MNNHRQCFYFILLGILIFEDFWVLLAPPKTFDTLGDWLVCLSLSPAQLTNSTLWLHVVPDNLALLLLAPHSRLDTTCLFRLDKLLLFTDAKM